jgi:hypothetical protein
VLVQECLGLYWVLQKKKGQRGGRFGLSFEIRSVNCFFRRHIVDVFALPDFLLFYLGVPLLFLVLPGVKYF